MSIIPCYCTTITLLRITMKVILVCFVIKYSARLCYTLFFLYEISILYLLTAKISITATFFFLHENGLFSFILLWNHCPCEFFLRGNKIMWIYWLIYISLFFLLFRCSFVFVYLYFILFYLPLFISEAFCVILIK